MKNKRNCFFPRKYSRPRIIYKQFHKYVPLSSMGPPLSKELQWFSIDVNYGESYGSIVQVYTWKKAPKLLDIGNAQVRTCIREWIFPYEPSIVSLSDPDEQYSGGGPNKLYHALLRKYFGAHYDGTIINSRRLTGNDEYTKEDLDGASEIVLWRNYDELLSEAAEPIEIKF